MSVTERRQIENEMIFRRINEQVGINLDTIDAMHIEDGNPQLVRHNDMSLEFKCECSDENCDIRIPMTLDTYRDIHINRNHFIVKANHQIDAIEKVIVEREDYYVVKKNKSTSEPGDMLNKTMIKNV
jgi:thermostable 8-oxoguanine DNA glycosylase